MLRRILAVLPSIDFRMNTSYVWKKTKIFKNEWVITTVSDHDKVAFQAKTGVLLDKIAPLNNLSSDGPSSRKFFAETDSFFDDPFDFAELNAAIESRNRHSGCDPDGVDS